MLRLGARVRLAGQDALVVARTLAGVPAYDVRLADGRLVKYVAETDFEAVEPGEVSPPARLPSDQHARSRD